MLPLFTIIAYFLPLVLSIFVIIEATDRLRYVFIGALLILYLIPMLLPLLIPAYFLFFSRIALGITCYIYLRWKGYPIR